MKLRSFHNFGCSYIPVLNAINSSKVTRRAIPFNFDYKSTYLTELEQDMIMVDLNRCKTMTYASTREGSEFKINLLLILTLTDNRDLTATLMGVVLIPNLAVFGQIRMCNFSFTVTRQLNWRWPYFLPLKRTFSGISVAGPYCNNFRKVVQLLTTINPLYNSHKIAKLLTNSK